MSFSKCGGTMKVIAFITDHEPVDRIAPVLLPAYTSEEVRKRQLTAHYKGTLR
jgi:hypothetical protein